MRITIESTSKIVQVNGVSCRVWEGKTDSGIRLTALIPRIAVRDGQDTSQFERELEETKPPSADVEAWPLKMII